MAIDPNKYAPVVAKSRGTWGTLYGFPQRAKWDQSLDAGSVVLINDTHDGGAGPAAFPNIAEMFANCRFFAVEEHTAGIRFVVLAARLANIGENTAIICCPLNKASEWRSFATAAGPGELRLMTSDGEKIA